MDGLAQRRHETRTGTVKRLGKVDDDGEITEPLEMVDEHRQGTQQKRLNIDDTWPVGVSNPHVLNIWSL